jgi:hypothetical protein
MALNCLNAMTQGADLMLIAIFNQSTLVSNDDSATMTQAIAAQIELDVAPLWERSPATVMFYTDVSSIPVGAHIITITDTIKDQPAGVLGFHTEDQGGKLWGVTPAHPGLSNGGAVTTGDWSVSAILSQEVIDKFVDPNCNLWSNDGMGSVYGFDVCDPVQAPSYTVDGVTVSNFVTPAWFDPLAAPGTQFDKLGLLVAPFSILKGGYMLYATAGQERHKVGDDFPRWRMDMKQGPYARTSRRLAQISVYENS